ncbi:T9SS type A sorting domain-containing protein [Aquimarina sp. RZ0]|nr:T9SS type A sorting domain-containing protein [Aquimarina sp. RZ0]
MRLYYIITHKKMMTSRIILLAFSFITYISGFSQTKGDKLFDSTKIHELRITSKTDPNLYQTLQDDVDTPDDRPYYQVDMKFDGEKIESVGIRTKGRSSARREQVPMKIDINEFVPDQEFDGMKKINLTNSYVDEFRQKDRISYELFRRAGVPAPRSSYVEVYVNDEFINIYLLVQQIDKTFIKDHFADAGSLSKYTSKHKRELKYGLDVFGNFGDMHLGDINPQLFQEVYFRDFLKFIVINDVIKAVDNFPHTNYYTYYSEKSKLFHFLPWDYNFTFRGDVNAGTIQPRWQLDIIWNTPEYKKLYLEVACELSQYLFDTSFIEELISNNEAVMASNSQGVTVTSAAELRTWIDKRRGWLQDQLTIEGVSCRDYSYPLQPGDLVINEFVASSDNTGGIQEPDGGTPDWIELYNNTNQDIVLDQHFYLSDDIDFPKKWNFISEVTIPANGYLILWADRDIHQQGIHTNFQIKKSRGNLLLVYEDLTIIDQVNYGAQELNKAYARVPNGTGDFMIQDPTFNTNNEPVLSIDDQIKDKVTIALYPNPVKETLKISTTSKVKSLTLYSLMGQELAQQTKVTEEMNVASIPKGTYFIDVQTVDGNSEVVKFIKE